MSRSRRNRAPTTNWPLAWLRMITRSGSFTSGCATQTPPSDGRPSHSPGSVAENTSGASMSRSTVLRVRLVALTCSLPCALMPRPCPRLNCPPSSHPASKASVQVAAIKPLVELEICVEKTAQVIVIKSLPVSGTPVGRCARNGTRDGPSVGGVGRTLARVSRCEKRALGRSAIFPAHEEENRGLPNRGSRIIGPQSEEWQSGRMHRS